MIISGLIGFLFGWIEGRRGCDEQERDGMKVKRYKDGTMKLHIEDEDNYEVTDDNGVDIWLTKEQVSQIAEAK